MGKFSARGIVQSYLFAKDVLIRPDKIVKDSNLDPSKHLFKLSIISGLLTGLLAAYTAANAFLIFPEIALGVVGIILFILLAVIYVQIFGRILHIFGRILKIFKKEDLEKTLAAVEYSFTPFAVFFWLGVIWTPVYYVLSLWNFIILVFAVSNLHDISRKKSFALILALYVILTGLYLLITVPAQLLAFSIFSQALNPMNYIQ